MKKLLAITLSLALLLSLLTACGAPASQPAPASAPAAASSGGNDITQMKAEIIWWAFPTFAQENADDPAGTYEQKVIDAFNQKYPNIKVTLQTIDFTSGPDAITAAIEGNAAPDVLFDAPGRIIEYGKNGKLVSLDDLFTADFVKDVNNEALINACKGDGTAYMYPISSAPFYMAINKAMWEGSGAMEFVNLEGDRAWTTENLENALKALKDAGHNPGTLFCQGQGGDQGTRAFVANLYGAQMASADFSQYTMNSDAGIKGLTLAQDWIKNGLLGNGVAYNGGSDIELFVNGNTAFALCWGASTQLSNQPTLDANGIETISLPFPSDDGVTELEYLVNGFCVFDNGDETRAAAAKEFIQFICDDAAWGPDNVVRTNAFPVRTSFGDLYKGDAEKALLSGWTKYYGPYTLTMNGWANQRTEWWNMLQAVTNGDDVKTALDTYANNSNAGM